MPFLKPPAPDDRSVRSEEKKDEKSEVWTIVLKKGEILNIEYEK